MIRPLTGISQFSPVVTAVVEHPRTDAISLHDEYDVYRVRFEGERNRLWRRRAHSRISKEVWEGVRKATTPMLSFYLVRTWFGAVRGPGESTMKWRACKLNAVASAIRDCWTCQRDSPSA